MPQKEYFQKIIDKCKVTKGIINNEINMMNSDVDKRKLELSRLNASIQDNEDVRKILLAALTIKKNEMKFLETIVNTGLRYVYPNKDLKFNITFTEKNNRIVPEFWLGDLLLKSPFIGDGGGVISVISLLIYTATIKLTNKRIILLDEAESMVDISAAKKLFTFLNTFAIKNNLTIIIITQKALNYDGEQITDHIKLLKLKAKEGEQIENIANR